MGAIQLKLIGQKFNRLIVINQEPSVRFGKHKKRMWNCLCDCGTKLILSTGALTSNNTKSCGCLHDEISIENSKISRYKVAKLDAGYNSIISYYKRSAHKRGLEFDLTTDEFRKILVKDCYYCGSPPGNVYDKRYYNITYNGIDRVDNNIGYNLQNCVPCCKMCNVAKNNHAHEEFMNWIIKLTSKYLHDTKGYSDISQIKQYNDFEDNGTDAI